MAAGSGSPDVKEAPDENRRPMVVATDHGLCNRLRTVLSYRQVAAANGQELMVVWRPDDDCNGEFLDCFAPLPGVTFVSEPPSWDPDPETSNCVHPDISASAEIDSYAHLMPSTEVEAAVAARLLDLAPFAAVHIRRTDLPAFCGPGFAAHGQTTDAAFEAFLDRHAQHRVFVASCCGKTHARFRTRYARRLGRAKPPAFSPHRLRQTALVDAAADLFTCASAEHFLGSHGSSFSEAIEFLRSSQRGLRMRSARRDTKASR